MVRVFAHPFDFNPALPGQLSTIEVGSDDYKSQQIAAFLRTQKGERPIYQDFGLEDPTFQNVGKFDIFAEGDFAAEFSAYYDDIALTDINITEGDQGDISVLISYQ